MAELPSSLPDIVADDEDVARFLTLSGQYNSTGAKHSAFLPNPKDRERSVFRHSSEPREGLWQLAREHVIRDGQHLLGAALVRAGRVRSLRLEILAIEPPPRHAAIVCWPWPEDPELRKAQQKELALVLAQHSQLVLV